MEDKETGVPLPMSGSFSIEAPTNHPPKAVSPFPLCLTLEEGWEETMEPTDLHIVLLLSSPVRQVLLFPKKHMRVGLR